MSEVWSYFGAEATGKTTIGFTAIQLFPDGIEVHFDFDLGRERAIWRFPKAIQDRIKSVRFPEVPTWTLGSGAITQSWANFERTYEMALNDPQVRVLFVDTGTQMHRLNADEYLENYVKRNKPNRHQLQQVEYRFPNNRTRAKIMAAREAQKLLIISHYERPVYVEQFVQHADGSMGKESVDTGQKECNGFGDMAYASDQHLQLFLRDLNMDLQTGKMMIDPGTGKPFAKPRLVNFARFIKPNPPSIFGMEVPEPNYERLVQTVEMVKKASMEGMV
uniref:Uncharacterized protein n=1 Tax=viral metagenome TaxID=1070528 RepID=A0A6H1ZRB4_9ZZZZ